MVTIAVETPDQEDVRGLLREADARSAALYPAESRHGLGVDALVACAAVFFVARLEGEAVGCGGFVPGGDGRAELKRMFVRASARRRGIGGLILRTIEDAAAARGVRVMQLETGVQSAEALALYRGFRYRERGPFGAYRPDPLSVFMEKRLAG